MQYQGQQHIPRSPPAVSQHLHQAPSLWGRGPVVKRRTRCTVTIKHCTRRVEATVVKQLLISHPFPILLSRLELLSPHMLWIHSHLTYTLVQMFWFKNISDVEFDLILMACFMRLLDTSWIITLSCIVLMLICNLLCCSPQLIFLTS